MGVLTNILSAVDDRDITPQQKDAKDTLTSHADAIESTLSSRKLIKTISEAMPITSKSRLMLEDERFLARDDTLPLNIVKVNNRTSIWTVFLRHGTHKPAKRFLFDPDFDLIGSNFNTPININEVEDGSELKRQIMAMAPDKQTIA